MNKELQDLMKKLQAKNNEQEKKLNETTNRYNKLREDLASADKMLQERAEQINKALKRIKLQDAQIADLEKERRNKDSTIAKYQKNIQGASSDQAKTQYQKLETELKEALKLIDIKDHEIKLLKDLVKSYQHQYKQKEYEISRLRRGVKLSPLTRDTSPVLPSSTRAQVSTQKSQTERKIIRLNEGGAFSTTRDGELLDNKIHLQPIDSLKRETGTPDILMRNPGITRNELDLDNGDLPDMGLSAIEYDETQDRISREIPDTQLLLSQLQEAEQHEQDQEAKINQLNEELYNQRIEFDAPSKAVENPAEDISAEVTFDQDSGYLIE
jgi:hypothetical protein